MIFNIIIVLWKGLMDSQHIVRPGKLTPAWHDNFLCGISHVLVKQWKIFSWNVLLWLSWNIFLKFRSSKGMISSPLLHVGFWFQNWIYLFKGIRGLSPEPFSNFRSTNRVISSPSASGFKKNKGCHWACQSVQSESAPMWASSNVRQLQCEPDAM